MKDISICLAHRGDPMGLWLTIMSCEEQLRDSKFDYEYNIVVNGESGFPRTRKNQLCNGDLETLLFKLSKTGRLNYLKIQSASVAPQTARQLASEKATGKYLFFFDNHCIAEKGYFERAVLEFEHKPIDLLHSTTRFFFHEDTTYHYVLQLEKTFWAKASFVPLWDGQRPYRIAAAGHGGFAVRSDAWREVGGYGFSTEFVGYAGEEIYCDVLFAMCDKQVWISPHMIHAHWCGTRVYQRHYSPDYYRNLLSCAYLLGGEKWLYRVFESFRKDTLPKDIKLFDLLVEAYDRSRDGHEQIKKRVKRTLDEQLLEYRRLCVAY